MGAGVLAMQKLPSERGMRKMASDIEERTIPPRERAKKANEILRRALQQPGIKEMIEVYGQYQALESAAMTHRRVSGLKQHISSSSSSGPQVNPI